jgi:hypothetical protein
MFLIILIILLLNLVLLEKREEIEAKMKDIFDTQDMKKVVYRLKAVLLSDGQYEQGQYYAYIWVSRGNKTEAISSNNENGTWWKFCDTNVEEVRLTYKCFIRKKESHLLNPS